MTLRAHELQHFIRVSARRQPQMNSPEINDPGRDRRASPLSVYFDVPGESRLVDALGRDSRRT